MRLVPTALGFQAQKEEGVEKGLLLDKLAVSLEVSRDF
jgi:hypothetical protein